MLNTGFGFLLFLAWRKTGNTSHPQGGRSIAYHTKVTRIFLEQKTSKQKCFEMIGVKNAAINANTKSLNIKESNTNAAFLNVRMKK